MKEFKRSWQRSVDKMGDDWSAVLRFLFYALSIWYGLFAILAPVSDHVFVGTHRFYELWQKLCFSAATGSISYGLYKIGRSYRTTALRNQI